MTATTNNGREFRSPRRNQGQSNNIVVGPASLLPFKREWRALAAALPSGAVLFIELPSERSHAAMQSIAAQFRVAGRHVKSITPNDPGREPDPEARGESAASLRG